MFSSLRVCWAHLVRFPKKIGTAPASRNSAGRRGIRRRNRRNCLDRFGYPHTCRRNRSAMEDKRTRHPGIPFRRYTKCNCCNTCSYIFRGRTGSKASSATARRTGSTNFGNTHNSHRTRTVHCSRDTTPAGRHLQGRSHTVSEYGTMMLQQSILAGSRSLLVSHLLPYLSVVIRRQLCHQVRKLLRHVNAAE